MLFRRNLKNTLYVIVLFAGVLLFSSRVWYPQPLIVPLPELGFIDFTEVLAPMLLLIPISFMYYNSYEIELSLVCGVHTRKLFLGKFFAILLYGIIVMLGLILAYQYLPYTGSSKVKIPINIPENYKLYMIVSAVVTMFFFATLCLLLRVLTRNCYAPIGILLFVYTFFTGLNEGIHSRRTNIRKAIFDPFISNYILGDKVTERIFPNLWTLNRFLFFGLGLVMLIISCIILNREKQHENFGD